MSRQPSVFLSSHLKTSFFHPHHVGTNTAHVHPDDIKKNIIHKKNIFPGRYNISFSNASYLGTHAFSNENSSKSFTVSNTWVP